MKKYIDALYEYASLRGSNQTWSGVLFVEDARIDWDAKSVSAGDLCTEEVFAGRFSAILGRRPSWIKLTAEGIWKDRLVVVLSHSTSRCAPGYEPELLYSGVSRRVADDPQWDLSKHLRVTP